MKKNDLSVVICFVLFQAAAFAQEFGFKLPDSLKDKPYRYFYERMEASEKDTLKAVFYIDAWLKKAKQQNDLKEIVNAFDEKIYFSKGNMQLQYADSALVFALKTKDNIIIGEAYSTKGTKHYFKGDYAQALKFYLESESYLSKTENEYLKSQLKYSIASIKFYLEFYEEALRLFEECASFFKQSDEYNYQQGYLSSLHSIGLCHNRMGNYEKTTATNRFALQEAERLGDKSNIPYIRQSEGINEYFKKNYEVAIKEISEVEPELLKVFDFRIVTVGHFYIGKSYWDLKKKEKAVSYFKKVDQSFEKGHYIRPDFREGYEFLVKYYKEKGDVVNQLFYINRLIKADSVLNSNFKNISLKIYKEYDTKALLEEKENAENKLAGKDILISFLYGVTGVLFICSLFFFYRHYKNQKLFKTKLNSFLNKEEVSQISEPDVVTDLKTKPRKALEIKQEVVESILKDLEKFELKHKFLKKEITLVSLAKDMDTNSNYLSKVIQHYRNKNFTSYLADLRIGYITKLMQSEARYRNYTIKALADEAGFSTPQHFSKAFFAVHGFYPSFFLSEMGNQSA